jgi:hypothetical protein
VKQPIFCLFLALWLMTTLTQPAEAYIEPGNGSMLLQLLLGGSAGLVLCVKMYWRQLCSLFAKRSEKASDNDA